MKPALLFWCQHSVGLGHLARAHALCAALRERFRVVLVCGGALPDGIARAARASRSSRCPPLGVGETGRFVSHDPRAQRRGRAGRAARAAARRLRRRCARACCSSSCGRSGGRSSARELLPLLERARARRRRPRSCSLRDILVSRRDDQASTTSAPARSPTSTSTACSSTATRAFARLEDTFAAAGAAARAGPLHRLRRRGPPGAGRRARRDAVVVSAGGGRVGAPLLRAALGAQRVLWPRTAAADAPDRAGRSCPPAERDALAAAAAGRAGRDARPQRRRRSAPSSTAPRRRSASAATTPRSSCSRRACPALVVPYATPEEDEQRRRARRLARLGALRVLDPERLAPEPLAGRDRARSTASRPRRAALDLDGARATTELLWARRRVEERVA